jgi:hypothetical protein
VVEKRRVGDIVGPWWSAIAAHVADDHRAYGGGA